MLRDLTPGGRPLLGPKEGSAQFTVRVRATVGLQLQQVPDLFVGHGPCSLPNDGPARYRPRGTAWTRVPPSFGKVADTVRALIERIVGTEDPDLLVLLRQAEKVEQGRGTARQRGSEWRGRVAPYARQESRQGPIVALRPGVPEVRLSL